MSQIQERGSTHVYKVNKISKEEMDAMTARCVYEQPPFCRAACPLKLDVRAFMKAAADGDFKKALQLYEKVAPFPLILSAGCEAPCEGKCRLGEIGDAVAIRAVEAAVARFGEASKLGGVFRMKKRKTVAVLGADLFTLLLAGELEKKAYPITVFCEQGDLESYLRVCAPFLRDVSFALELKRLKGKDIQFEFDSRPDAAFYEDKKKSFDVLCASKEVTDALFPAAVILPELMYCEEQGLVCGACEGVLDTAFGAKRPRSRSTAWRRSLTRATCAARRASAKANCIPTFRRPKPFAASARAGTAIRRSRRPVRRGAASSATVKSA